MRIAYVITRADSVGGASVHVCDLASAMLAAGHQAKVYVGGIGPVTDRLQAAGVPFVPLPSLIRQLNPFRDVKAYYELKKALASWKPDLVSAHTAKAGWLGRAAAHALGIPVLYTPHGLPVGSRMPPVQAAIYTLAERIAAPWAAALVCVSAAERDLFLQKRIGSPDRLHVIHNGVRDTPWRAEPAREPVQIVSIARFESPKDHGTLFDALRRIDPQGWQLTLIGDGPDEARWRAEAPPGTRFLGYRPDPAPDLAGSQIFVLASRSEGFPRSILEAMRAGLPVVASDVGGVGEAVVHGETGLLVPPRNPIAMADALERFIKSAQHRQLMGANGRLRYQELFKLDRTVDQTMRLYATIGRDEQPPRWSA